MNSGQKIQELFIFGKTESLQVDAANQQISKWKNASRYFLFCFFPSILLTSEILNNQHSNRCTRKNNNNFQREDVKPLASPARSVKVYTKNTSHYFSEVITINLPVSASSGQTLLSVCWAKLVELSSILEKLLVPQLASQFFVSVFVFSFSFFFNAKILVTEY